MYPRFILNLTMYVYASASWVLGLEVCSTYPVEQGFLIPVMKIT